MVCGWGALASRSLLGLRDRRPRHAERPLRTIWPVIRKPFHGPLEAADLDVGAIFDRPYLLAIPVISQAHRIHLNAIGFRLNLSPSQQNITFAHVSNTMYITSNSHR